MADLAKELLQNPTMYDDESGRGRWNRNPFSPAGLDIRTIWDTD